MNNLKNHQRGITKIKTLNFGYTWTIHNFSFNDKEFGQCLKSPTFRIPDKQDYEWFLALFPKGEDEKFKDRIAIYLELQAPSNPSINTKIKLAILNSKNEKKYTCCLQYTFKKRIGYGTNDFLKQSILLDSKNDLLTDDKLTIVCQVTAGVEAENFCQDTVKFEENRSKFTLNSEFESLFKNKHMTDVTLVADGKELKAHKAILVARSPVFLAMLQIDMQEKQNNRIEFADVSVDVLSEMLQYIYTGTVKNIKKFAFDLLKLADKYDIKGLKLECEELLYSELSINNAINLFILADRHNCEVLRPLILKFIIAHAKDIMKTEEFKTYEKDLPILIKEMMHAIV